VFSTFEQRLRSSLEKSAEKKAKGQNKQQIDPATGRKLFEPDTHLSKMTYFSHFKKNTSSIEEVESGGPCEARPERYAELSGKLNQSHEDITTTFNYSLGDTSQLTRRCEGRPEAMATIPGKREERLAECFAELIWTDGRLHRERLEFCEERVLVPFLEGLCEFEYSVTVSRQVFKTLFKDFLGVSPTLCSVSTSSTSRCCLKDSRSPLHRSSPPAAISVAPSNCQRVIVLQ
jgi:hypothetical protein